MTRGNETHINKPMCDSTPPEDVWGIYQRRTLGSLLTCAALERQYFTPAPDSNVTFIVYALTLLPPEENVPLLPTWGTDVGVGYSLLL